MLLEEAAVDGQRTDGDGGVAAGRATPRGAQADGERARRGQPGADGTRRLGRWRPQRARDHGSQRVAITRTDLAEPPGGYLGGDDPTTLDHEQRVVEHRPRVL